MSQEEPLSLTGLKVLAIFIVFIAGLLGPSCPVIFSYFAQTSKDQRRVQKIIKVMTCLSIGIILATALIHMLSEGIHQLEDSGKKPFGVEKKQQDEANNINKVNGVCEIINGSAEFVIRVSNDTNDGGDADDDEDEAYPFGMLFAIIGIGAVYIFSTELNWYGMKKLKEIEGIACDEEEEQRQASLVKLYLLECGVAVHSIIIGVTCGIAKSYETASTLFVVLCVHQFFEGLAIGSLAVMAHITFKQAVGFIGTFALTTPIGIIIGIAVSGDTDQVVQGVLSCLSAGILLQMALCEMLPHVFGSHQHHSHGPIPLAEIADKLHNHHHHHGGHSHSHQHQHQHTHSPTEKEILRKSLTREQHKQDSLMMDYGAASSEQQHQNDDENNDDETRVSVSSSRKSLVVGKGSLRRSKAERARSQSLSEQVKQNFLAAEAVLEDGAPKTRASATMSDYVDDHEDDESLGFRLVCYAAFFVGCSIQALLGIWA